MRTYETFRDQLDELLLDHRQAKQALQEEEEELRQCEIDLALTEAASDVLQDLAITLQESAHQEISGIVTKCLQAIFDDPYEFKIIFERKRGKTEARFLFSRNDLEVDPLTAAGGGVVDVAAFALRLACILLSSPARRRLMVLDEPFKFVSAANRERIGDLLETLAEELDFQFIIVTHIEELHLGEVHRIDA